MQTPTNNTNINVKPKKIIHKFILHNNSLDFFVAAQYLHKLTIPVFQPSNHLFCTIAQFFIKLFKMITFFLHNLKTTTIIQLSSLKSISCYQ